MSIACNNAQKFYRENKMEIKESGKKPNITDGDFVINGYYFDIPKMKDDSKIPEIKDKELEKLGIFAENNDLILCCYYGFQTLEEFGRTPRDYVLVKKYSKPKNWKERLRKISPWREKVIYVGDHYFASNDSELFEKVGRDVFGLKADREKQNQRISSSN